MQYRRAISSALIAAMLGQLAACATWKVQESAPEQVIAEQSPGSVKVTKTDGTRLTVWDPQVVGDSLSGLGMPDDWGGAGRRRPEKVRVSVPLEDIQHVEVRGTDWETIVGITIGLAVIIGLVVVEASGEGLVIPR